MLDSLFIQKSIAILQIAQSLTVTSIGILTIFKFKLYRLWQATQKSEMVCSARRTAQDDFIFEAEYKVFNTGERPLQIRQVILRLCQAKQVHGVHLMPDPDNLLAARTVFAEDQRHAGSNDHFKQIGTLGYVNKGTYSSFTLRCRLKELPDVAFVLGEFSWQGGTRSYSEMWVKEFSLGVPLVKQAAVGA